MLCNSGNLNHIWQLTFLLKLKNNNTKYMDRRTFISIGAVMPFFGLSNLISCFSKESMFDQNLKIDSNNIIDLHPSLNYKIISKKNLLMSDGFKVPGLADGMGSFLVDGKIVLVRNHEIVPRHGMDVGPFENVHE